MTDDPIDMDGPPGHDASGWTLMWPISSWYRWLRGLWTDEDRRALAEVRAALTLVSQGQDDAASRLLGTSPVPNRLHALAMIWLAAAVVRHDGDHGDGRLLARVRAHERGAVTWQDTDTRDGDVMRTAMTEFYELTAGLLTSAAGGPDASTQAITDTVGRIVRDTHTPAFAHLTVGLVLLGSTWGVAPETFDVALAAMRDPDESESR